MNWPGPYTNVRCAKAIRPDFAFAIALRAAKHLFPSTNSSRHKHTGADTHDMQRAKQHCQSERRARGRRRDTSNGIIHDFHRIVPGGLRSNKAQGLPPGVYITTPAAARRVHEYQITHSLIHSSTAGIYFTADTKYTKHILPCSWYISNGIRVT